MSSFHNSDMILVPRTDYNRLQTYQKQVEIQAPWLFKDFGMPRDKATNTQLKKELANLDQKNQNLEIEKASYIMHLGNAKKELKEQRGEIADLKLTEKSLRNIIADLEAQISDFGGFLGGCTKDVAEKFQFYLKAQEVKNKNKSRPRVSPIIEIRRKYTLSNEICRLKCQSITIEEDKVLEIEPEHPESPYYTDYSDDSDETLVNHRPPLSFKILPIATKVHSGDGDWTPQASEPSSDPQVVTSSKLNDSNGAGDLIDSIEEIKKAVSRLKISKNGRKFDEKFPSLQGQIPTQAASGLTRPETPAPGLKRPPLSTASSSPQKLPEPEINGNIQKTANQPLHNGNSHKKHSTSLSAINGNSNADSSESSFPSSPHVQKIDTQVKSADEIIAHHMTASRLTRPKTPARGLKRPPFVLPQSLASISSQELKPDELVQETAKVILKSSQKTLPSLSVIEETSDDYSIESTLSSPSLKHAIIDHKTLKAIEDSPDNQQVPKRSKILKFNKSPPLPKRKTMKPKRCFSFKELFCFGRC